MPWFPFTGTAGVCLFFIISGFLITSLLLNERGQSRTVCLRLFYIRRCLRIFPPFYCYLAVISVLLALKLLPPVDGRGFLAAATYWRNFYNGPSDWVIEHTWSLSVEEQFYLIWPIVVSVLSLRRAFVAGVVGVAGWPLLQMLRHGQPFHPDGHGALEKAAIETVLYGSLLAMAVRSSRAKPVLSVLASGVAGLVVPVALLWLIYRLNITGASVWPKQLTWMLSPLRNSLMTWFLWWCVQNQSHPFGRFLEARPVAFLGSMSYSLYLWQQPFLGFVHGWAATFPQNYLFAFVCAAASFFLVEKPLNSLRRRWQPATTAS
jgi:peptidoglycan/LPS O-acetylase OafA/YrhL